MPGEPQTRKVVLVAGSGRSGTSTFAGILRELGLHIPQPEVAADETNPKGFAEPRWVVDFHDELLARVHVAVSDARPQAWVDTGRLCEREPLRARLTTWLEEQFAEADELVVKDPRLSWFLDLWRASAVGAGAEPVFVTMLRPPPEVAKSKQQYYNKRMADAHAIAGWVNMMLSTERLTRGTGRVYVRYQDLIDDWASVVLPLGERLGLAGIRGASPDAVQRANGFVDPSLRRLQPAWDDLDLPAELREMAEEAWRILDLLADDDGDAHHAALDALAGRYAGYYAAAEAVARSSIVSARAAGVAAGRKKAGRPPAADVRRRLRIPFRN